MSVAALEKLRELTGDRNPVETQEVCVRDPQYLTAGLVRAKFEAGKVFDVQGESVAVQLPSGAWLWVGKQGGQG